MALDYTGIIWHALIPHLVWIIPAMMAATALRSLAPRLSGWLGEALVAAKLKHLFSEVRHDLILPDGRGEFTQIDHLALTPAGLLVVETKTYRGSIYGTAKEPTWTQAIGRQRHSFQNPLRQNYGHVRAIEALVPDIPVESRVVFAGGARFPKGLPEGVCYVSELADEVAPLRQGEVSPALRTAWERVLAASRTDRSARKEHLRGLQARHGGVRRPWVPATVLALSVLWLGGLWLDHRSTTQRPSLNTLVPPSSPPPSAELAPASPAWKPLPSVRTARLEPPRLTPATAATPSLSDQDKPPAHMASIEWAPEPQSNGPDKQACAVATAAVLIDNSEENRRTRDRACGQTKAP